MNNKTISYVALDADHQGHLLNVLADAHTLYNTRIQDIIELLYAMSDMNQSEVQEIIRNYTYVIYMIGNIEGKLLRGLITEQDLEFIEDWEEEVIDHTVKPMDDPQKEDPSWCPINEHNPCNIACPAFEDCAGKLGGIK